MLLLIHLMFLAIAFTDCLWLISFQVQAFSIMEFVSSFHKFLKLKSKVPLISVVNDSLTFSPDAADV